MTDLPRLIITMLAVANPPRTALLWPEGTPPVRRYAAAWITIATVLVLALVSEPLLDLLDVTSESFRIAAGAVLVAGGLRSVGTRPVAFGDDGPAGWASVLAPATFPILLHAEVIMASVSLGADDGVGPTVLAAVVGIAAAAVAPATTHRWVGVAAGRVMGALLVVMGFERVVSGVLDI